MTSIELRRRQVADMALQGFSIPTIAKMLHVSPDTIYDDYRAILQDVRRERESLGELVFDRHLAELESLIEQLRRSLASGEINDKLVGRYLQALQERAHLLGLYPDGALQPQFEIKLVYGNEINVVQTPPDIVEGRVVAEDETDGDQHRDAELFDV